MCLLLSVSVALIGGEAKWIHTQSECCQVPGTDRNDGRMGTESRKVGVMGYSQSLI